MGLRDLAGTVGGFLLAPITGAVALVRRSRMFHPDGTVHEAELVPDDNPLGQRLGGHALVRLSSAWWKNDREWIDVLGLALRLGAPGDATTQDLLFATVRHPLTTPFAPLTTKVHDFLANDYYAVSPFAVEGGGRVFLRLLSPRPSTPAGSRRERLAADIAAGRAELAFEIRGGRTGPWRRIATLRLGPEAAGDHEALRFDPFRDGRGLRPVGFVHALRRAAYGASQRARALATSS